MLMVRVTIEYVVSGYLPIHQQPVDSVAVYSLTCIVCVTAFVFAEL